MQASVDARPDPDLPDELRAAAAAKIKLDFDVLRRAIADAQSVTFGVQDGETREGSEGALMREGYESHSRLSDSSARGPSSPLRPRGEFTDWREYKGVIG